MDGHYAMQVYVFYSIEHGLWIDYSQIKFSNGNKMSVESQTDFMGRC